MSLSSRWNSRSVALNVLPVEGDSFTQSLPDRTPQRRQGNPHDARGSSLAQQRDITAPVAVRPAHQRRHTEQLEKEYCPHDAVDERITAKLGDQIDQKRAHNAEPEGKVELKPSKEGHKGNLPSLY